MKSVFVTLQIFFFATLHAQSPEELFRASMEDLKELRFDLIIHNTHSDDLKAYKEFHLKAAKISEEKGVHQYFTFLPWTESVENLNRLSPIEIYENLFEQLFGFAEETIPNQMVETRETLKTSKFDVIGQVERENGDVYVVYEYTTFVQGMEMKEIKAQGFRREGKSWKFLIDPETVNSIKGMILFVENQ